METSDLFRPVGKKENSLRTGRTISHVAFYQLPFYHKPLITTDGGMCACPNLNQKKDIIVNAVNTLRCLGYERPKIAVLCCKEHVDGHMPGVPMASYVAGAKIPIVLTSWTAPAEEKLRCIALAGIVAAHQDKRRLRKPVIRLKAAASLSLRRRFFNGRLDDAGTTEKRSTDTGRSQT